LCALDTDAFRHRKQGRLEAKRLDGVVLLPAESVNSFLDRAEPWKPREKPNVR